MIETMNQQHVADVPRREADAYVEAQSAEDPTHVYFWEIIFPGTDARMDELRARGLVRVSRIARLERTGN